MLYLLLLMLHKNDEYVPSNGKWIFPENIIDQSIQILKLKTSSFGWECREKKVFYISEYYLG